MPATAEESTSAKAAAAACEKHKDSPLDYLECLADAAEESKNPDICRDAKQEGIRLQCLAILAERLKDAALCGEIPTVTSEHQALRDACLGDVAKARETPSLCAKIQTPGLRDSCYLKTKPADAGADYCEKIKDPGLKSSCTGEPVWVE